jgi:mono/diheme cytochrome c family protein
MRLIILLFTALCLSSLRSDLEPADGESLYEGHCRDCHSDDFRQRKNGPALGNIHLHRDRAWLIKFIQSSTVMIKSGEELANCVYRMNGKKPMPSFYFLKKNEVEAILDYIEKESKKQKIGIDENRFPCKN